MLLSRMKTRFLSKAGSAGVGGLGRERVVGVTNQCRENDQALERELLIIKTMRAVREDGRGHGREANKSESASKF
jgi:hypothetical protein